MEKTELPPNMKENVQVANIEITNNQSVEPGEYWVKIDGEWQKRDSKDGLAWPLVGISDVKRKGVFIQLDVGDGKVVPRKKTKIDTSSDSKAKNKPKISVMQMLGGKDLGKVLVWFACVFISAIFFVLAYDPQILKSPLNWSVVIITPKVMCFFKVMKSQDVKDPFEVAMEDHQKEAKVRTSNRSKISKMRKGRIDAPGPLVWTNKKAMVHEN